jgi:hypothetical protein
VVAVGLMTFSFKPRLYCTGWTVFSGVLTFSLRSPMSAAAEFFITARFRAAGFSDY